MRGGIANYMSTYWPVSDSGAEKFSTASYDKILSSDSIGKAMPYGRKAIFGPKKRIGQTTICMATPISY